MSDRNGTDSTAAPANVYSLPGAGRGEAIMGVTQIYKMESGQTAGSLECVEITVPPGQGIGPQAHRDEDEFFYVIAGCVVIEGDDLGDAPVGLDADASAPAPARLSLRRAGISEIRPHLCSGSRHSSIAMVGRRNGICRSQPGYLEWDWNAVWRKCSLPPIMFENRTSTCYMTDIRTDRVDPNEQRFRLFRG